MDESDLRKSRSFVSVSLLASTLDALMEKIRVRDGQLHERIKQLEDRLPLAYGGTWSEGQQSNKGVFYTDRGSLWYCREATRDRPGASSAFQLTAKAGRDGKDLR